MNGDIKATEDVMFVPCDAINSENNETLFFYGAMPYDKVVNELRKELELDYKSAE